MATNENHSFKQEGIINPIEMIFPGMLNAIESKSISYEQFDAYYRILKKYVGLNEENLNKDNYLYCGNYAITLAHAMVTFRNPNYDRIGYVAILNELDNIIRKVAFMKLNNFNADWSETIDYEIKKLRKNSVNLDDFGNMCSFLGTLIMAGIEEPICLEFAYALRNAQVIGIKSDIEEEKCQGYRFQVSGMINHLENLTKKDPTR